MAKTHIHKNTHKHLFKKMFSRKYFLKCLKVMPYELGTIKINMGHLSIRLDQFKINL